MESESFSIGRRGEYPLMKKRIFIFDLDGTVIDSSHRQGNSLDDWFRLNTRENIFKDVPLSLGRHIRNLHLKGHKVLICTSRNISKDDLDYLEQVLKIPPNIKIIARPYGCDSAPFTLKKKQLSYLQNFKSFRDKIKFLIDDNEDNLKSFEELGSNCFGIFPNQAEDYISRIVLNEK